MGFLTKGLPRVVAGAEQLDYGNPQPPEIVKWAMG